MTDAISFFSAVSKAVIDAFDQLSEADRRIGDGDHGVGMRRGFEAALNALGKNEELPFAEAAKMVGDAVIFNSGGASGAIFGTLFKSGAPSLENGLNGESFAEFLEVGLESVMKIGGVTEGQKTMVDSLAPAAKAAREASAKGTKVAMSAAAKAANEGVKATRSMVATAGKAQSLGERSLGFPDPGAITISIILGAMEKNFDAE